MGGVSILRSRGGKWLLQRLLGDYQYWVVYCVELPQESVSLPDGVTVESIDGNTLADESDPGLRDRAEFDGSQAQGFGLYVDGQLVAIQWYWWGERYWSERQGRSWALSDKEVKSVGLYTIPEYRGGGYAALLKQYTAGEMYRRGFQRLYSRIWHSHRRSIAVSRKAGWRKVGSYVEIAPFGRRMTFRLRF